jgi:hypothetical protein
MGGLPAGAVQYTRIIQANRKFPYDHFSAAMYSYVRVVKRSGLVLVVLYFYPPASPEV